MEMSMVLPKDLHELHGGIGADRGKGSRSYGGEVGRRWERIYGRKTGGLGG